MATELEIEVSYSQLSVFASSLPDPFNDWSDPHVAQGFSWRPGSVSFRTLVEEGTHRVELLAVKQLPELHADAVRVIEVPFEVPEDGDVEIGSISQTVALNLPPGSFLLRCEFLQPAQGNFDRVRLTFAKEAEPRFAVVRADPALQVPDTLLTTAQPALG